MASGILNGGVGMGGPPLVMWTLAHRWTSEEIRASLIVIFILVTPVQFGLLVRQFGRPALTASLLGLLLAPLLAAGAMLGLWLSARLATVHLRRVMFSLLIFLALLAILEPVVRGMMR